MASAKWRWLIPTRVKRILAIVLPIICGAIVFAGLVSQKDPLPRAEAIVAIAPDPLTPVHESSFSLSARGFGTARAKRVWRAVAEVNGEITAIHPSLESGNAVETGELLVQINPTDYELRVNRRQAEKQSLEAELRRMETEQQADKRSLDIQLDILENQVRDVARMRELATRSAASSRELEESQVVVLKQQQVVSDLRKAVDSFPARKSALLSSIASAQTSVEEALRDVQRARIIAPMDGLLSEVSVEVGQVVQAGQYLGSILDVSTIEVNAQFSASALHSMDAADLSAGVGLSTEEGRELNDARVLRWGETVNERTRTRSVVVEVANRPETHRAQLLLPGAFCEVLLTESQPRRGIVLPSLAVTNGAVMVEDLHGCIGNRQVDSVSISDDRVWIRQGLKLGDRVAVGREMTLSSLGSATARERDVSTLDLKATRK